jgi:hypothetical protein
LQRAQLALRAAGRPREDWAAHVLFGHDAPYAATA